MEDVDRGRLKVALSIAVAVAVAGLVVTTGFVFADDDPTGEDVLDDVRERYESAESVSADTLVTVESDNGTASTETAIAAADRGARLNLSTGESYVTAGTDGDDVWVYEPQTDSSVGFTEANDTASATLRAGTVEQTVADRVPIDGVRPTDTVGDLLEDVDEDELPEEWRETIEELPRNATLAELAADGAFDDLLDDAEPGTNGETEDAQAQAVADRLLARLTESLDVSEVVGALETGALGEASNGSELSAVLDAFENGTLDQPGEAKNESTSPDEAAQITAVFESVQEVRERLTDPAANQTVELLGTATVQGVETNELRVSSADEADDLRLWVDPDSSEIRKVEWTDGETTVTVTVRETRFDVSPADSTFEPPGAVELATVTATSDEFAQEASLEVPDIEGWGVERASRLTVETSFDTGTALDDDPETTVATYTDDDRSIFVARSSAVVDTTLGTETIAVDNRTVRLGEANGQTIGVWTDEDTTTAVVGDLSASELRAIIRELA